MKYTTAFPYFPEHEISFILQETQAMLRGEKMLSMGENIKNFEQEFANYCGKKYGIVTNSCTSALNIVLRALNLKSSDEIIVPVQTFFADLSSIVNTGAKPIFCDTDENFILDFKDLKNKITKQTKAVIIVHFSGAISKDIFEIKNLCVDNNITLIEDCAHAHGASVSDGDLIYRAGGIGDIACFSFFSTKIITTGEGGMILCDDKEQSIKLRALANRGLNPLNKNEEFIYYGENYRLTEFSAILGLSQLRCLEDFITHRNKIAQTYKEELNNMDEFLRFQESAINSRHAYWRFIIFLKRHTPRIIIDQLAQQDICADAPYFPLLHQHKILKNPLSTFHLAESLSKTHISLPIHMKISISDAKKIAKTLKNILISTKNISR